MKKDEFLAKLKSLLMDIPVDEREEALAYYRSYFEDAGEENEDKIIMELESPEKVASIIKSDCVTDVVGAEGKSKQEHHSKSNSGNESGLKQARSSFDNFYQNNKGLTIFLIIVAALLASPVWLPVGGSLFGVIMGAAGLLFGLIVGSWGLAIGLIISGLVCVGMGIGVLFGLDKYRYEFTGLLMHAEHLEAAFGVGPHTISVPRLRHADDIDADAFDNGIDDDTFAKIVACIRTDTKRPKHIREIMFRHAVIGCNDHHGQQFTPTQDPVEKVQFGTYHCRPATMFSGLLFQMSAFGTFLLEFAKYPDGVIGVCQQAIRQR